MKKAALFFDIDGTLLSEITHQVPESAVHALEEAKREGHLLFINTGRTICSIPEELKRLPVHGFLCGCGIYGEFEEEIFFERHLDSKDADKIVKRAQECRIDAVYEGKDDIYFSSRISRFDRLESTRKYMNNRGLGLERYVEQGNCPYDKLFAYEDRYSDSRGFFDFLTDYMEVLDRGNHTYECIMKGYSKATIMEVVLEKYGISRGDSYVFGDSSNDLAMFQYGGHGIAMGVHDPVLDPCTEYIAPAVEDGAIWQAMKHYGLIL